MIVAPHFPPRRRCHEPAILEGSSQLGCYLEDRVREDAPVLAERRGEQVEIEQAIDTDARVELVAVMGGGAEDRADLRDVRLFVAGSAPLPATLFERCERVLGQLVLERYGITEGGIVVSNPFDGPRQAGRVGYPLPGVEVRLGEQDEVQLKGGQVFKGYWRNAAASADVFIDGWFRTGDIGEIAADGSLAIRGRIK